MAKKIIRTEKAILDRINIYKFWSDHNLSNRYSEKLELLFQQYATLISEFPKIGLQTTKEGIRYKVVRNFKIFYQEEEDQIVIFRVWDVRQDPESFEL